MKLRETPNGKCHQVAKGQTSINNPDHGGYHRFHVNVHQGATEDTFNRDRWDYVYTVRNGATLKQEDRLSVYFEADNLSHFTSSFPANMTEQVEETETAVQAFDDGEASESSAETE